MFIRRRRRRRARLTPNTRTLEKRFYRSRLSLTGAICERFRAARARRTRGGRPITRRFRFSIIVFGRFASERAANRNYDRPRLFIYLFIFSEIRRERSNRNAVFTVYESKQKKQNKQYRRISENARFIIRSGANKTQKNDTRYLHARGTTFSFL